MDRAAIQGAILSTQIAWYTPVIYSRSKEETVKILKIIGEQNESGSDVIPLRSSYRPRRLKSRQLYVLQGLPKVGPTIAKRLLEHFKSVKNVINTPIDELTQVEGIGAISAQSIKNVLDKEI